MKRHQEWVPMTRTKELHPPSRALIRAVLTSKPYLSEAGAIALLEEDAARCEYWINDLYQVEVRRSPEGKSAHLNIRRRDGAEIYRDWRHFQRIKNEIVGPECEAVELYPAESRKVDTSNKYHLWAVTDPSFRFPIGFERGDVRQPESDEETGGLRQRKEE